MISVCIPIKNAFPYIQQTLDAAASFPEILLLDNGSSDETLSCAKRYKNVRIERSPFIGFGPLRNKAASLASHDWILALDSDEILSPALTQELHSLRLNPACVYGVLRHNFYNGKRIQGCGWHPDWVVRLYHRDTASYTETMVHESVAAEKRRIIRLKNPLIHTPYRSTADFLAKMQHYSTLFAEQNRGKRSSTGKAAVHAAYAFLKSYFLKQGFRDGAEGFIISLYNANTTFYKYIKLAELSI